MTTHLAPSGRADRALALLCLLGLGACSGDPSGSEAPPTATTADLALTVSSSSAEPGSQIVVALGPVAGRSLAGLQGTLRYDAERLSYVGQSEAPAGGHGTVLVTNWAREEQGAVRLLAIDTLLRRLDPAMFAFDVKGSGYTGGLRVEVEAAVAAGGRPIAHVQPPGEVEVDPALALAGTPRRLTVEDWAERLGQPRSAVRIAALLPGQGARYGDANLDGNINVLDALVTANVAVGNTPLLTDATKDFAIAANVHPANLPGLGEPTDPVPPGREPDGSFVINVLDVSVITNESVGNDPPIAGDPIPGRTPRSGRAVLSGTIAANRTLSRDTVYELSGIVTVPNFVTLTLPAGTQIEGQAATHGALDILLGGRMQALGTRLEPVVMTCTAAVKTPGCWGGLTIAGPALLNNGDAGSGNEIQCPEKPMPDGTGVYGGCLVEFSSGVLRYTRIEYAGMAPGAGGPAPGLQLLGVGSGTQIDSVQVHRSLGAGLLVSGGRAQLRGVVLTGDGGGGLAWSDGWQGKVQSLIIQRGTGDGPAILGRNADNPNAGPRSQPLLSNVTIVGPGDGNAAVQFVSATGGLLTHAIVAGAAGSGLDIDDAATCALPDGTLVVEQTLFFGNSPDFDPDADCVDEAAVAGAPGLENSVADPALIAPALTLTPDFRPLAGSAAATLDRAPPDDPFFDPAERWAGAVAPASITRSNVPWYAGWTVGW